MVNVDGHYYESEADAPDLGSISCVSAEGSRRSYKGYVTDEDKLPKYDDLGDDSDATLYGATGNIEKLKTYMASDKEWIDK